MRFVTSTSVAALAVAFMATHEGAQAQVVNTSPSNVNILNLLSPFLALNSNATGQATLTQSLDQAVTINNTSPPEQRARAISDKALPGSGPPFGTITLANGTVVALGAADNLAGGEPLQAIQNNPGQPGTIAPYQPVGAYGNVLGTAYQTGIRSSTATTGPLTNTETLLNAAYRFTSADLGVAKNYFANGAAANPSTTPPGYVPVPAVAPAGYTLPTFNGLPNTTDSVLDLAYGVTNRQPGQDVYGDSRPVQVAPTRITSFDPTALNGLATNPSFPSGHTTYAYTDSILLGMLTPSLYQSALARAADYGNDRIVLGVHYPLDIIGSRALASYDLVQAFTNPLYLNNAATTSGTAIDLPTLFNSARTELASYLSAQCGATVAACASSAANTADDPYAPSAATQATYQQRLTYGLPTLTLAQAPQEAAPAGGPDASILLAPIYGGSTSAATAIAPDGGLLGTLQTSTINQIIVNTETNALASFYGSALSYWTRIDLYAAAGYFGNLGGTLTLAPSDTVTTPVTIGSTGTLYGNGATINGAVTATAGGTFGGGSATGVATTTVNGNLVLQAGSNYAVTAAGTKVSATQVAGTAAIGGATLVVGANGTLLPFTQAQVLTATGGLSGTFANAVSTPATLRSFLSYGANGVTLTLDRTDVNYAGFGATTNQVRVATAIGTAAPTTTTVNGGTILNALFAKNAASAALGQATLDRLGGEGIAATQNAALQSSAAFVSSIDDAQAAWRTAGVTAAASAGSNPLPVAAQGYAQMAADLPFPALTRPLPPRAAPQPWRVWGGGFGGQSDIDGRPGLGTAHQDETFYGGLVGVDYQAQPNWLIGVAGGGTGADFTVPNRATSGTVTGGHGALYSSYGFADALYLQSSLAFSGFSNETRRTAGGVGVLELEKAAFDSFEVRVRGEIGKRFDYGTLGVTPFAAVEYANLSSDGFTETAPGGVPGLLSLHVAGRSTDSLPVFAGLRFDGTSTLGNGMLLRPFAQVAYLHEFEPARNLVNTLVSLPGASFLVEGARPASNAAQAKAGFELGLRPGVALFANFDGEFSDVQTVYAGKGGLRVSF